MLRASRTPPAPHDPWPRLLEGPADNHIRCKEKQGCQGKGVGSRKTSKDQGAGGEQNHRYNPCKRSPCVMTNFFIQEDAEQGGYQSGKHPCRSPRQRRDLHPPCVDVRQQRRLDISEVHVGLFVQEQESRRQQVKTFVAIHKSVMSNKREKQPLRNYYGHQEQPGCASHRLVLVN